MILRVETPYRKSFVSELPQRMLQFSFELDIKHTAQGSGSTTALFFRVIIIDSAPYLRSTEFPLLWPLLAIRVAEWVMSRIEYESNQKQFASFA